MNYGRSGAHDPPAEDVHENERGTVTQSTHSNGNSVNSNEVIKVTTLDGVGERKEGQTGN